MIHQSVLYDGVLLLLLCFFVLLPARALKQCVIPTLSEVSYLDPALAVTDTVAIGDPVSSVDTINPLDNFSVCGSREGASAFGAA